VVTVVSILRLKGKFLSPLSEKLVTAGDTPASGDFSCPPDSGPVLWP